jgi:hypothetical protein
MPIQNKHKNFSVNKYYKLVSLLLIFPIWWTIDSKTIWPMVYFCLFGVFGMLGEIIFSEWWMSFYEQPLYKYSVQGIVHSYSARINYIPWGAGGLFCLWVISFFSKIFPQYGISLNGLNSDIFYYIFILCFFAGLAFQFMVRVVMEFLHPRSFKFKTVRPLNQLLFLFPFMFALTVSGILFTEGLILLALIIGISASFFEYLYGKILERNLGTKFWKYKPFSFDGGHFTPLVIIPFSILGFYFWAIYGITIFLFK